LAFSAQYDNLRIYKRALRLKGRPQWQDALPDTKSGRDTYRIAAKYEKQFGAAFLKAIRNLLPEKIPKEFKEAFDKNDVNKMYESLPLLQGESESPNRIQEKFLKDIEQTYLDILQESGEEATQNLNKDFKTKLGFSVVPLAKAKKITPLKISEGRQAAREAARGFMVPINPHSTDWMKNRSLSQIKDFTKQQRETVNGVLANTFEKGIRAEETYKSIKENIGLTAREYKAVVNRESLLVSEGLSKTRVKEFTDKYREGLLKRRAQRIARTETIRAQARGRQDAWRVAQESGQLPPVKREWVAAPPGPNPDRPCEICMDLAGKRAPINGVYDSLIGSITGPPDSHPNCRCTEILVRAEAPSKPKPARRLPEKPIKRVKRPIAMPPELKPKKRVPVPVTPKIPKLRGKKAERYAMMTPFVPKPKVYFQKVWEKSLTERQKSAITHWSGIHYQLMRKYDAKGIDLTKVKSPYPGTKSAWAKWHLKHMRESFDVAPPYIGKLYRGMEISGVKNIKKARSVFVPGRTFEQTAISSWSKSEKAANEFAYGQIKNTIGIRMRVATKLGGSYDIADLVSEGVRDEIEVLVEKNKKFKITKVAEVITKESGLQLIVDLEELR
jgi:hypothetical protein